MTTITQVARRAGVGVGTVSRVLNRSPQVAGHTRQRVLAAIDELGYAPNAAARALSTGRTGRIGVVAPFFTRPSVIERLRGLAKVVDGADHQVVLFAVERPEQRTACFSALAGGGSVDGVLSVSLGLDREEIERFQMAGVPVVLVDRPDPRLPSLGIDDVAGGRIATEHLLSLGHRRIAFVGDAERDEYGFTSSARRRAGYEAALRDAGIEPDARLIRRDGVGRVDAGRIALRLLADDAPPTAIFAASDEQALGVLDAAGEADVAVPGDLSVVGFDDVEVARWAGLTTVSQPLEESGARGAEMILSAIAGQPVRSAELELELVRRATTAEPGKRKGRRKPSEVRSC